MTSSSIALVRNTPYWWRVSRYDSKRRDERGAYQVDAWTSVSDVGRIYDEGYEFTFKEYQGVEASYVDVFLTVARESDAGSLQVRELERGTGPLAEGAILPLDAAAEILRAMLREDAICKLETPKDDFAVHVGFDLYMYIGSSRPCHEAARSAAALGLYAEPDWRSPQLVGVDDK